MKFSLFVHMERWDESVSHRQLFEDLTELTLMAEAGGFSTVWIGEHHAMEYTISPSPMPLLAYLAAKTTTIHLGAGTIIAPFWHPLRVAGECALLDVISNGRMEVGLARGAYQVEFDRMAGGMPASSGGQALREMVPVVRALWQGDYAHDGDIWKFPTSTSVPKPIQKPNHNPGWRDQVMDYLKQQFPETKFNFLNAGIPSLGSLPHAFRIDHDVFSKGRADLVFLESAVNDSGNGTPLLTQRRALEGIVRQLTAHNPYTDVVMMAFLDPDKIKAYNSGKVPPEVKLHEAIAKEFKLSFINLAREVTDRINAGEFTWDGDFKNLHPSPFGQNIYFRSIQQLLGQAFNQTVSGKLIPHKLPVQSDPLVYAKGTYLDIRQARVLKGFEWIDHWQPTDSARGRAGFVNIPVLSASDPNATFELDFKGTAIGFAVLAGPDAGMVSYQIDGQDYPALDLYTAWSKNLHLPWYLLFADDLKPGGHHLKLTLTGAKNAGSKGTACRIAYFLLNNPAK